MLKKTKEKTKNYENHLIISISIILINSICKIYII